MSKNLVIVESPAKAKTIEGYLGKDFVVKSSMGHVRDLPKGNNAIQIDNGFKPIYEVTKDKLDVVKKLREAAAKADTVWLATDDDREGEAISWHLAQALGLDEKTTPRIVFREITKTAIQKALQQPRSIDLNLVNAQQARRILDRLVGFELSPVLWKKIQRGLSAGRVQSVAVRIVVEREREIEAHQAKSYFKVTARFTNTQGKSFPAELSGRLNTEAEASALLATCQGAEFLVKSLETKPAKRTPSPPFTTSTLQQEASRKLSLPPGLTMSVAQKLYEAGKISYMRTDSLNLSEEAIGAAAAAITQLYGSDFVQIRRFKTKNESAQEAHEAIRPTNFSESSAGADRNQQRLYELIYKRAIASQMADAQLERTVADIAIVPKGAGPLPSPQFVATGEVVLFEGFMKVYIEENDSEETEGDTKVLLPKLAQGELVQRQSILAKERYTRPAPRYTEASLIKKMEELGIGRPSTYAPTISTIQDREYVEKNPRDGKARQYVELELAGQDIVVRQNSEIVGAEKGKLFPTDVGRVVTDFLVEQFKDIVDFSFTANIEKELDQVADGKTEWDQMIARFYKGFHQSVEEADALDRSKINISRDIGTHPVTGLRVSVRLGKFGPMVQIGETEGDEKPTFASLRKDQSLNTITLEDALELFKLPRTVGEVDGEAIVAAAGRFGPYLRFMGKFYSLPVSENPLEVTLPRAKEIIEAKLLADANRVIKTFSEDAECQVLNGRWGPYVALGKQNLKIPKGEDAAELTYARVLLLADEQKDKPVRGGKAKPPAKTAKAAATTTKKKPAAKSAAKPAARPVAKSAAKPAAKKTAPKKPAAKKG